MSEVIASLVVSADALADALKKFKNIVPKPMGHGSAAMRDNILLGFTQDYKLCLYAENYETGLKVVVDTAESHGLASLVVSYSGLVAAVSAFKHEDLLLYLSDILSLRGQKSGGIVECLSTLPMDKYPQVTETADVQPLVFPAGTLLDALAAIAPCINPTGTINALQHVHFAYGKQGGVELVTTDSHRMAVYAFPGVAGHIPEVSDPLEKQTPEDRENAQYMPGVNNKAVAWMLRHAERSGGITIRFDKKHAEIAGNSWTLFPRLYDGRFPLYSRITDTIPAMPGRLVVKRAELLDALKKARAAARDEPNQSITLAGSGNGEALDVYCKTGERVVYTATIPAASRKFPGFTATCGFLIDMVAAFPDDLSELRFAANDESDFIVTRKGDLMYVLVPMGGINTKNPDYLAALAEPDQEYPGAVDVMPSTLICSKRPPSFKAVVKYALTDDAYRQTLLSALGIQNVAV